MAESSAELVKDFCFRLICFEIILLGNPNNTHL